MKGASCSHHFYLSKLFHIQDIWYICCEINAIIMTKIVHVHLIYEKKNLYFGSISAIFEALTEEQVGITKSSLLHAGMADGSVKYTKRAMIIQSHLIKTTRNG